MDDPTRIDATGRRPPPGAAGTLSDAERKELDAMPPRMRRIARPYVLRDRCIGCGTCENVCPLDGPSGIRVERLQTRAIQ